jgi:hypothetical protein
VVMLEVREGKREEMGDGEVEVRGCGDMDDVVICGGIGGGGGDWWWCRDWWCRDWWCRDWWCRDWWW